MESKHSNMKALMQKLLRSALPPVGIQRLARAHLDAILDGTTDGKRQGRYNPNVNGRALMDSILTYGVQLWQRQKDVTPSEDW